MDERTLSEAAICIHSISSCSLTHSTQQYRTCGTHFGCTNEPASIVFRPVLARRFTNSILVSAGILVFSFCRPSLGPTSTIRTWSANARREEVKLRVKLGMQSRLPCRLRSGDGGMIERICGSRYVCTRRWHFICGVTSTTSLLPDVLEAGRCAR